MSRQIGNGIRRICDVVVGNPGSTLRQVAAMCPELNYFNVNVYLGRATKRGFLSADTSDHPIRYTATDHWTDAVIEADAKKTAKQKPVDRATFHRPSVASVWDLAR